MIMMGKSIWQMWANEKLRKCLFKIWCTQLQATSTYHLEKYYFFVDSIKVTIQSHYEKVNTLPESFMIHNA